MVCVILISNVKVFDFFSALKNTHSMNCSQRRWHNYVIIISVKNTKNAKTKQKSD
jgi:hypothetical protein